MGGKNNIKNKILKIKFFLFLFQTIQNKKHQKQIKNKNINSQSGL